VSCSVVSKLYDITIKIVDTETFEELEEGKVGEIWINSPSKALGYFGQIEKTKEIFQAKISKTLPTSTTPFSSTSSCVNDEFTFSDATTVDYLRTGDLGFLLDKHLYICGRLKDMIIIRGRNIYPQDIEMSCENTDLADVSSQEVNGEEVVKLRKGCTATFSIQICGEEVIVFVAELNVKCNDESKLNNIILKLRQVVEIEHSVPLSVVCLVEPRTIAKTTSGKIARQWVKKFYLENTLKLLMAWSDIDSSSSPLSSPPSLYRNDNNDDVVSSCSIKYLKDRKEIFAVSNEVGIEPQGLPHNIVLIEVFFFFYRNLNYFVETKLIFIIIIYLFIVTDYYHISIYFI
jgi:acyl-CoA synthetase (AMP-forming)/AMP-acid ligase II